MSSLLDQLLNLGALSVDVTFHPPQLSARFYLNSSLFAVRITLALEAADKSKCGLTLASTQTSVLVFE